MECVPLAGSKPLCSGPQALASLCQRVHIGSEANSTHGPSASFPASSRMEAFQRTFEPQSRYSQEQRLLLA